MYFMVSVSFKWDVIKKCRIDDNFRQLCLANKREMNKKKVLRGAMGVELAIRHIVRTKKVKKEKT